MALKDSFGKLKEEGAGLEKEVRDRTVDYVVGALGIVAGLAWNDAVKSLIEYFFPASQNTLWAKFFYAILITVIVVLTSVYLVRLTRKGEGRG